MPRIDERHPQRQTTGKALLAGNGVLAGIALWLLLRRPPPCPPCGPPLLAFGGSDGTLGPNVTIASSVDGKTWTARPNPLAGGAAGGWVYRAVYAPELALWVAVGDDRGSPNHRTTMVSADGIAWHLVDSPFDGPLDATFAADVTWAPALGFVAVGAAGLGQVAISPDGVAWTAAGAALAGGGVECIEFAPELGLLVAGGNVSTPLLATSPDGNTWTPRPSPFDALFAAGSGGGGLVKGIAWSPALGLLVAVGADGRAGVGVTICTSPDGIAWTHRPCVWDGGPLPATFQNGYGAGVMWADWLGLFVAVGGTGVGANTRPSILTSPDGVAWTARMSPFVHDQFGALGIAGDAATGLVATGANFPGAVIATSPDGIIWTPRGSPFDALGAAGGVAVRAA